METTDKSKPLQIIEFGNQALPLPIEPNTNSDDKYVPRGTDNLYPNYLLSLYNKSPIFSNIITQKGQFIQGGGLTTLRDNKPLVGKPNPDDTWESFTDKIVKSFLIFNSYAIEVNFNAFGEPVLWNFISYEKVRLNKSKTKVWVNDDWTKTSNILTFDRYVADKSYDDTKSKVFVYDGYAPSSSGGIYPLPEYYSLIRHLTIDIEITEFNLSNIQNHFSVGTLINVYQNASEEVKSAFMRDINRAYTGSEGNKVMVSFNNPSSDVKPTDITPLSAGDWADKFEAIKALTHETIFLGMGVVNPSLFGYKSAGSLGNTQELLNSYEILSKNVINVKRNELEAGLREVFNVDISFLNVPLFDTTLSDDVKKSVLTIDEIRESAGLKPLPNGAGAKLIGATDEAITQVPQTNTFSKESEWEKVHATPEQFEKVAHVGVDKTQFQLYEGNFAQASLTFSDESDIASFLINNDINGQTLAEIKKDIREQLGINVSTDDLQKHINTTKATGVIDIETDGDKITVVKGAKLLEPVKRRKVETVYEYVKRPEATGESIIPTTRPFCQKIIDSNKFYSLEDVQFISSVLNYDVFLHTGGFWRKKGTAETAPHCRHQWLQRSVVRRPNDNL
jgi:hypothetical protein